MANRGFTFRVTHDFDLATYRRMLEQIQQNTKVVHVGIPTGPEQDGTPLAMLGAAHEFGVPGRVPERPWLYTSITENRARFVELNKRNLAAMLRGEQTVAGALQQLGLMAASAAQQKIYEGPFTPNAQATIDRKGSSQPLIDTAAMVQSVKYDIADPADD